MTLFERYEHLAHKLVQKLITDRHTTETGPNAVDEGGFLTKTISAGSGTIMQVDHTGPLTLDRALNWIAAQGVAYGYNGSAPDAGAFERGMNQEPSRPKPPQTLRLTRTVR